ncbi:MAG: diacylglycerol/lipid kinase family protein [Planctomycetota bacterium]|jgi:YegS/Rv2252/BmrU family lipid kinase
MSIVHPDKPVHLIINPRSGYGGAKRMVGELRAALKLAGWCVCDHQTRCPNDATEYAASVAGEAGAVVVWGGDGTINEVTNALAGTNVPVLPCPAGTENLLCKELHVPLDISRLAGALEAGYVIDCDVGRINGRNFLLIIGVGFDGEVVRRLTSTRTGHISHLSYFWPIWRTFWEHNFPRMRIESEGETIFDDYGLAFVGNISRYAVGLRICRDASFNDGLFDLVVCRCSRKSGLLWHAAWTLLRRHPLKGDVLYRQLRSCRIETDPPVACQVDGDLGPSTPIDVAVSPNRVRLIVPRPRRMVGLWPWKGELPI